MHPDPYIDEERHEEFLSKSSDYKLGFHMGLTHVTDNSWYNNKIEELEQKITVKNECIEILNNKIVTIENELKISWYRKLLNKLPRISITIKRGV